MTVILFILVLGLLVFVHELGHFLVAKATKMKVLEFAIGFPPKIFSKKIGETLYSINIVPLGGFVKIFGETASDVESLDNQNYDKNDSFLNKPKLSRLAVLVAGVLFNFIFAWLCFSFVYMLGVSAPEGFLGRTDKGLTTVTMVSQNSPAQEMGIGAGDVVLSVKSGNNTLTQMDSDKLTEFISENQNSPIVFDIKRGEENIQIQVTPKDGIIPDKKAVGIAFSDLINVSLPIHKALAEGYMTTVDITKMTVVSMWNFFGDLFTGKDGALSQVSGPVGIANMVGDASKLGISYLVTFIAIISVNLAVLNLIPFPALDGGQIVFVLIEAVMRKPISPKIISWINMAGFSALILLMIVVTFSDILKFF